MLALDGFNWGSSGGSSPPGNAYHLLLAMWSDQWLPNTGSASTGTGYHLLLALWSDQWVTGTASATASPSLSFSLSQDEGAGDGGHHKRHPGWFEHGRYRMADSDYWAAREKMLERHVPLEPRLPSDKPVEVVELVKKHDRLMRHAEDIFNLPDLSELSRQLNELSTQILNIELQSDDEALMVLLLS